MASLYGGQRDMSASIPLSDCHIVLVNDDDACDFCPGILVPSSISDLGPPLGHNDFLTAPVFLCVRQGYRRPIEQPAGCLHLQISHIGYFLGLLGRILN